MRMHRSIEEKIQYIKDVDRMARDKNLGIAKAAHSLGPHYTMWQYYDYKKTFKKLGIDPYTYGQKTEIRAPENKPADIEKLEKRQEEIKKELVSILDKPHKGLGLTIILPENPASILEKRAEFYEMNPSEIAKIILIDYLCKKEDVKK